MASYWAEMFSEWAAIAAFGVAFAFAFGEILLDGGIGGSVGRMAAGTSRPILPICVVVGIIAAAFQYMQNGELLGKGFGSILYRFVAIAIISAISCFLGTVAGGFLAIGILKISKRSTGAGP